MTLDSFFNIITGMGTMFLEANGFAQVAIMVFIVVAAATAKEDCSLCAIAASTIAVSIMYASDMFTMLPEGFNLRADYMQIFWFLLYYLAVGVVWSFIRWIAFLVGRRMDGVTVPPRAADYVDRIALWFYFWPLSIVIFVFANFTTGAFKLMWKTLGKCYDVMSYAIFPKQD